MADVKALARVAGQVRDTLNTDKLLIGGIDYGIAGGTLTLGTVNATALSIGSIGVTATVLGNLSVNGIFTIVDGGSMFGDGDITLGGGDGDTITLGGSWVSADDIVNIGTVNGIHNTTINLRCSMGVGQDKRINFDRTADSEGAILLPDTKDVPVALAMGMIRVNAAGFFEWYNGAAWVTAVTTAYTLDDAYSAGVATITVDAYDVTWNVAGAGTYSFVFNLAGCTGALYGFFVEDGTDFYRLTHAGADTLNLSAELGSLAIGTSLTFDVNAVGAVTIDSTAGTLGIGEGANAFAINIGTGAAARQITIGNVTTTTGVAINTGTSDFLVNATQLCVDQSEARVGINVAAPAQALDVYGKIASNGVVVAWRPTTVTDTLIFGTGGAGIAVGGDTNTLVGIDAGASLTTAQDCTFVGYKAGYTMNTGTNRHVVAVGSYAGYTTTGLGDACFGYGAGQRHNGSYGTFIGYQAGYGAAGYNAGNVVVVGYRAGYSLGAGANYNVYIGSDCGYNATTGVSNLFAGQEAGKGAGAYTGADYNVCLGYRAGYVLGADADSNVMLGPLAGSNHTTGDNQLYVANAANTSLIYGDFSGNKLGLCWDTSAADPTLPTYDLSIWGSAAREFGVMRHTTADTAGNSLTIRGGGATVGATNKAGGNLNLYPGVSTGSGTADTIIYAYPGIAAATTDNTAIDQLYVKSSGVGIGTSTVPHGGIGLAKFAIEGTDTSAAGPHIQFTTSVDDYPLFQQFNWAHDNVAINFDAYVSGAIDWRSSHAGSNYQIYKTSNLFSIRYDSGIAQGAAITWNDGIVLNTSGYVGIGTAGPTKRLHVYESASGQMGANPGAVCVLESSAGTTLNLLAPNASFSAIYSGDVSTPTLGGVVFTNSTYAGAFPTNATTIQAGETIGLTVLNSNANVGIGASPTYRLDVFGGDVNIAEGQYYRYGAGILAYAQTALHNYYYGSAGNLTTTGTYNVAIGDNAAIDLGAGADNNVIIGANAGRFSTTGIANTFIGTAAGQGAGGYAGANYNTAVGYRAGYDIGAAALNNSLFGASAGENLTTGTGNTALGYAAGEFSTTGINNVFIGYQAARGPGAAYTAADRNVVIGYRAAYVLGADADQNTVIGSQAGYALTAASADNTFVGSNAGYSFAGNYLVAVGASALYTTTGVGNSAFGYRAGVYNSTGTNNTFVGYEAGLGGSNPYAGADGNTCVGFQAGYGFTGDANNNTLIGIESGKAISTADYCVCVGSAAGRVNTTTDSLVAVGTNALYNTTGAGNTGIGHQTGYWNSTGTYNTYLGFEAGYGNGGGGGYTSSDRNVCVGYHAGYDFDNGSDFNVLIGSLAGENITTGDGNVCLGNQAGSALTTEDNYLYIANSNAGAGATTLTGNFATGSIGVGMAPGSITARLHLPAGDTTASSAPLKFTDGATLATIEQGATEMYKSTLWFQPCATVVKQSLDGTIFSQTATVTVANTNAETTLVGAGRGSVSLPANYFVLAGKTLRVTARGYFSSNNGIETLKLRVKLTDADATEIVLETGDQSVGSRTDCGWEVRALLTCYSIGATGNFWGQGFATMASSATASDVLQMVKTAVVANLDTTSTMTVNVTADWNNASAANTITCTNLIVEAID